MAANLPTTGYRSLASASLVIWSSRPKRSMILLTFGEKPLM